MILVSLSQAPVGSLPGSISLSVGLPSSPPRLWCSVLCSQWSLRLPFSFVSFPFVFSHWFFFFSSSNCYSHFWGFWSILFESHFVLFLNILFGSFLLFNFFWEFLSRVLYLCHLHPRKSPYSLPAPSLYPTTAYQVHDLFFYNHCYMYIYIYTHRDRQSLIQTTYWLHSVLYIYVHVFRDAHLGLENLWGGLSLSPQPLVAKNSFYIGCLCVTGSPALSFWGVVLPLPLLALGRFIFRWLHLNRSVSVFLWSRLRVLALLALPRSFGKQLHSYPVWVGFVLWLFALLSPRGFVAEEG